MKLSEELENGVAQLGITLGAGAQDKLLDYLDLLQKWNKAYNLTAVRERSAMLTQHLLDSLSIVPHLPPGDLRIRRLLLPHPLRRLQFSCYQRCGAVAAAAIAAGP